MAPQHLSSSNVSVEPGFVSSTYPAQYLLSWIRWALTTSWFLFLLAAVLVGFSLLASFYTDAWHWFQRSGALMVSIGAVLSTRRALSLILEGMISGSPPTRSLPGSEATQWSDMGELRTCVCGFMFVAMGTLIWAYGDLFGCLLHWNSSCLVG
jgi:hypothetical protein